MLQASLHSWPTDLLESSRMDVAMRSHSATNCIAEPAEAGEVRAVRSGRRPHLFGQHAGTMIRVVWQADLYRIAKSATESLEYTSIALTPKGVSI